MSLVQQCLESLGGNYYNDYQLRSDEAAKYTMEDGAFLINMESTVALNDVYSLEYEMESIYLAACVDAKRLGVPVEEGIGAALSKVKEKLGALWNRAKEWFKKMKAKVYGWFENLKKTFREMFAKPKELVKDLNPSDYKCYVEDDKLVIESAKGDNSGGGRQPAAPSPAVPSTGSGSSPSKPERKKEKAPGKAAKVAIPLSDLTMYKYTNLEEWPKIVRTIYNDVTSKGISTIENLIKEVDKNNSRVKKLSEGIDEDVANRVTMGINDTSMRALDAGKEAAEAQCNKYCGGLDHETQAKFAFRYFRNGATDESDKRKYQQSLSSDTILKDARAGLLEGAPEKRVQEMQKTIDSVYSQIISNLQSWESKLKESNVNGQISGAVSKLISAFSILQGGVNTMTNAWVAASREKLALYGKIVSAVRSSKRR